MKQFKIIDYYSGDTIVLSGGTKLDGFETEKEAYKCMEALHQKAIEEKTEVHNWITLVIPMGEYRKMTPPTMKK